MVFKQPLFIFLLLLTCSNIFMNLAWYAHLKRPVSLPLVSAIAVSWFIALFEYALQVPANRLGHRVLTLPQLKIIQEVLSLSTFALLCLVYFKEPLTKNYLIAAALMGLSVYFVMKK